MSAAPPSRSVTVHYYAMLREARGRDRETRRTTAVTAGQLYDELAAEFGWSFPRDRIQLAHNHEFKPWHTALADGDDIAFIPPVAGG